MEGMDKTKNVELSAAYFGTPVALITTVNPDGPSNISSISSARALGDRYMLGPGPAGQALANLRPVGDLVIKLPFYGRPGVPRNPPPLRSVKWVMR